jgi:hypothetical protein
MVCLATTVPELVWRNFGSWIRTKRAGICPSERTVATALRNSFGKFLADEDCAPELAKFMIERMDLQQANAQRRFA